MLWCDPDVATRRAAAPRRLPGQRADAAGRRRARQDPARDARRRDGGAARGAVRPLLRQRRFHAAVRDARGPLRRAHRRHRDARASCGRTIEAALAWIDGPATPTATASSNITARTEQGLANQGWKDSHDAIFHADGRLAEGPIALAEVQGYVYAAKRLAARMRAPPRPRRARPTRSMRAGATRLRERFEAAFWCEELGTYALALDGDKRPAACAPPTPARCCSPASRAASAPPRSRDG